MNYRHAYHAGNAGDVLKHLVLLAVLEALQRKDKPLFYLDTHAGRGLYDLGSEAARRSNEAAGGILALATVTDLPPLAERYLAWVRRCSPEGGMDTYPGSPALAAALLRPGDAAALCELQPEEASTLRRLFARDERVAVHERDGYEALRGLLPPRQGRGLVLIDPPYERREAEYDLVVDALALAGERWPQGCLAAWYPIKRQEDADRFVARVAASGREAVLRVELTTRPADNRAGLNGSGMILLNAPWQLDQELVRTLPAVHAALAPAGAGAARVQWLVPPR